MKFDPFGQASAYLSEELLHRIIRLFMTVLLGVFLLHRLQQYNLFAVKGLWLAESTLFIVLISAYLLRSAPVSRSRGVYEIIIPLIGSALPFLLLISPPSPLVTTNIKLLYGLLWWMTAATALTVWGMWALRSSFSITVEARKLVTTAPYRFIRHPVYLGEILAAASVAIIRLSPQGIIILFIFIAIQLYRTRMEEKKLVSVFPEYKTGLAKSIWLWRL
ncbi:MAG: hypothetical protein HXX17_02485 [Geobacteraceae bacterium]|nr:hypothetical protein [Geobacteraceae bacterium]